MKKESKNIAGAVNEFLTPIVEGLGYILWDVEYVKEGSQFYLRITIDHPDGIDINDCEKVHRAIDEPLDELDPIRDPYMLEVSSPGLERELKYPWHFREFLDETVEVRAFAPLSEAGGAKQLTGVLTAFDEKDGQQVVTITVADAPFEIDLKKISNVKTVYDFNNNTEEES